jgi:hypothetical protein
LVPAPGTVTLGPYRITQRNVGVVRRTRIDTSDVCAIRYVTLRSELAGACEEGRHLPPGHGLVGAEGPIGEPLRDVRRSNLRIAFS